MPSLRTPLVLSLLAAAAVPAQASADRTMKSIIQDDRLVLNADTGLRDRTLNRIAALGPDIVKIQLSWSAVAGSHRSKPAGLNAEDPASYPEANWARYDGAIRAIQARGMEPMVSITANAPGYATGKRGDAAGVERIDADEFELFSRAVGRRYDGTRTDGTGARLPKVDLWVVWNEPNNTRFILPQSNGRGRLVAPKIYRDMVRGMVAGLRATGHTNDTILFGEMLPIGKSDYGRSKNLRPVEFLRGVFCLNSRLRAMRGREARRNGCRGFKRIAAVRGLGYHPYTRGDGPSGREPSRDDATIRSIPRIQRVLDAAGRRNRLSPRRIDVWNTEFGFQSNPPDKLAGARLSRIPAFLNQSEYIGWKNRRMASFSQYLLEDTQLLPDFQSGLHFFDGRPKPGVLEAYLTPIYVTKRGSRASVWGAARGAAPGTEVQIQRRTGSGFKTVATAKTNSAGYITRTVSGAKSIFRLRWTKNGATLESRATRPD